MRVLKAEVEQLVTALDAEYADEKEAAEAVFTLVARMLEDRDSFGIRVGPGTWGHPMAYGPFWLKVTAEAHARLLRAAGYEDVTVAPLRSVRKYEQRNATLRGAVEEVSTTWPTG